MKGLKKPLIVAFLISIIVLLTLEAGFCAVWRTHTVLTGEPPQITLSIDTAALKRHPARLLIPAPVRAILRLLEAEGDRIGEQIEKAVP